VIKDEIIHLPIDYIIVADRQRAEIPESAVEELSQSLLRYGLFNPILVSYTGTSDLPVLIQGGCRLAAYKRLHELDPTSWNTIPARVAENVTEQELILLELEENVRRTDLPWQDHARAVKRFHDKAKELNPDWRLEDTGNRMGMSRTAVARFLNVAAALEAGDIEVEESSGIVAANTVIDRRMKRQIAREADKIAEQILLPEPDAAPAPADTPRLAFEIINQDFFTWDPGPQRFNLIHCDFPYGIGWDKAKKGSSSARTKLQTYADDKDLYWRLLEALLRSPAVSSNAHIIFWLSGAIDNLYHTANKIFNAWNCRVDQFPLIWHRSDSSGMISDPQHSGRRTYETALLITRGDRPIIKPLDMSIASPSMRARRIHPSEKPEPVLRHFFSMLIDETTMILDPTCGSGTAIRAAMALGAKGGLGLELDPDFCADAQEALRRAATIQELQRGQGDL